MLSRAHRSLALIVIVFILSVVHMNTIFASLGITQIDLSAVTDQLFLELARAEISDQDKETSRRIIQDWMSKYNTHVCSPTSAHQNQQEGILHAAARAGHAGFLAFLLERELEINDRDGGGKTPLFLAAERGHCNAVRVLIDAGAVIGIPDNQGATPLHGATSCGHMNVVRLLVEYGADVCAVDSQGRTPLFRAAYLGASSIVRFLLSKNARVVDTSADQHDTPLHAAAGHSCGQVVRLLIEHGAVLDLQDKHGMTPLMRAAEASADLDREFVAEYEAIDSSLGREGGFFTSEYDIHKARISRCSSIRDTVQYLFNVSDPALTSRTGISAQEYVRECSGRFFDAATWGAPFYQSFETAKRSLDRGTWSLPVDLQKLIMLFTWSKAHQECYKRMKQGLSLNEEGNTHDE